MVAISIIVSVVSVVSLMPLLKSQHVTNAYNTTLAAMRQARDNAVSQRTSYSVTFSNTRHAQHDHGGADADWTSAFQGDQNTVTYQLPTDVSFHGAIRDFATASTAAPDGFGIGANAD